MIQILDPNRTNSVTDATKLYFILKSSIRKRRKKKKKKKKEEKKYIIAKDLNAN